MVRANSVERAGPLDAEKASEQHLLAPGNQANDDYAYITPIRQIGRKSGRQGEASVDEGRKNDGRGAVSPSSLHAGPDRGAQSAQP